MTDMKNFVVGISVTGLDEYWALAVTTLMSIVKSNSTPSPTRILIATDSGEKFAFLQKLGTVFGCNLDHVVPKDYSVIAPEMKGNFATYWKFELFKPWMITK